MCLCRQFKITGQLEIVRAGIDILIALLRDKWMSRDSVVQTTPWAILPIQLVIIQRKIHQTRPSNIKLKNLKFPNEKIQYLRRSDCRFHILAIKTINRQIKVLYYLKTKQTGCPITKLKNARTAAEILASSKGGTTAGYVAFCSVKIAQ